MLVKDQKAMGRGVRRMPFRNALKRDAWEPSDRANEIKAQWNEIRRGGGEVSFTEGQDSES
jgi:hypothetical protein